MGASSVQASKLATGISRISSVTKLTVALNGHRSPEQIWGRAGQPATRFGGSNAWFRMTPSGRRREGLESAQPGRPDACRRRTGFHPTPLFTLPPQEVGLRRVRRHWTQKTRPEQKSTPRQARLDEDRKQAPPPDPSRPYCVGVDPEPRETVDPILTRRRSKTDPANAGGSVPSSVNNSFTVSPQYRSGSVGHAVMQWAGLELGSDG